MNWRELNKSLTKLTEEEILRLLDEERKGQRRVVIATRLHQRYCTLRATRERLQLLKEITND